MEGPKSCFVEGRRSMKDKAYKHQQEASGMVEEEVDDETEEEDQVPTAGLNIGVGGEVSRKKGAVINSGLGRRGSGGGISQPCCQAQDCGTDLSEAKRYHRRHKVCEFHSKAAVVVVAGLRQRFCQQCSRFHEITEFDEAKRSCRRRLAGHNERRRKSSSESQGEGSSQRSVLAQAKEGGPCKQDYHDHDHEHQRGRIQITSTTSHQASGNSSYKHFHIR